MSCGCGCRGARPCAPLGRVARSARRPASRYGRRMRSIAGDDDGSTIDFNAVMTTVVADVDAAHAVLEAASQAYQILASKQQADWKKLQAGIETYVQVLSTAVGAAWAGALFNAWFSQQPGAAAGPGMCVTDPPSSPDWPTLRQWKYYQPWGYPSSSTYPAAKAGTFEAYAYPILEYNLVLQNNCFADKSTPSSVLLGNLLSAWNLTHGGPSRTEKVTGINPDCPLVGSGSNRYFDCSKAPINRWDPIAEALNEKMVELYPPGPGEIGLSSKAPMNVTMDYTVNDGPLIQKHVTLRLPPVAPARAGGRGRGARDARGRELEQRDRGRGRRRRPGRRRRRLRLPARRAGGASAPAALARARRRRPEGRRSRPRRGSRSRTPDCAAAPPRAEARTRARSPRARAPRRPIAP